MKKEITLKDIENFRKEYNENPANKLIENAITRVGIDDACFNRQTLIDNQDIFNIETDLGKSTDQKQSGRCWCFASTNMIRSNIAKNMNVELKDLELSNNYIVFFDKLEKINTLYENLLTVENTDYDYLLKEHYLSNEEGGRFEYAASMINKYGLVPLSYMPESHDSISSNRLQRILLEKIKYDANILLSLKKDKTSIQDLRKKKEEMLSEVYEILCKVLGEPTKELTLEYIDKDKKKIRIEHMTPLQFKDKYLTLNLNDFINLTSFVHYKKEFYKKYQYDRLWGSVSTPIEYINIPMEDLQKAAIKQLKDNIPIYFSTLTTKMWNRKEWILDSRNFNYLDTLGMKKMNREIGFNFHDIPSSHAMNFVGVHVIDNKPLRWKVENSWGTEKGVKQYIIMNNNFFEDYIFEVAIHKKYLTKKILNCLDQKPIIIKMDEL